MNVFKCAASEEATDLRRRLTEVHGDLDSRSAVTLVISSLLLLLSAFKKLLIIFDFVKY